MLEKERERTTTDHDTGLTRTLTQSKRTPHARRVPARVRLLPRRLEGECSVFIVRGARRILRRAPLGRLPLRRVHSQGIEREDGDTRRRGLARRRARRRRERTTHCSGCPNALPCPGLNRFVLNTKFVVRPQSSWGRAKGRRRSAPGSRPSALPCPGSQLLVRSTARRHLDILTPIHAEASSACSVMGTGVGKATLGAGV